MFDHAHYVPILKGKPGELDALSMLPDAQWDAFTPVIEIPPVPSEWIGAIGHPTPGKIISSHVTKVCKDIVAVLPASKRFFVDGAYVEHEPVLPDKQEPLDAVMSNFRSASLMGVPVVGVRRIFEYLTAAKAVHTKDRRGFCLRLRNYLKTAICWYNRATF